MSQRYGVKVKKDQRGEGTNNLSICLSVLRGANGTREYDVEES